MNQNQISEISIKTESKHSVSYSDKNAINEDQDHNDSDENSHGYVIRDERNPRNPKYGTLYSDDSKNIKELLFEEDENLHQKKPNKNSSNLDISNISKEVENRENTLITGIWISSTPENNTTLGEQKKENALKPTSRVNNPYHLTQPTSKKSNKPLIEHHIADRIKKIDIHHKNYLSSITHGTFALSVIFIALGALYLNEKSPINNDNSYASLAYSALAIQDQNTKKIIHPPPNLTKTKEKIKSGISNITTQKEKNPPTL